MPSYLELADVSEGGDFWPLLRKPAPLAGMAYPPEETDWKDLREDGYEVVLPLCDASYTCKPLEKLESVELEDLYGGGEPTHPAEEEKLVHVAAVRVVELISIGRGTIVHCVGGRGRTGTVLACALCLLGLTADEALAAVEERRGELESEWQREVVRRCGA